MTDWNSQFKFHPKWENEEFLGQRCFRKDSNTAPEDWKLTYSFWQDAIKSYCEQKARNLAWPGSKLTFTFKDLSSLFVTKTGLKPACLDQVLAEMWEKKVLCTAEEWETRPATFFSTIAQSLTNWFISPSPRHDPDRIFVYREVTVEILRVVHSRIIEQFHEDRTEEACILTLRDLHRLVREEWSFTSADNELLIVGMEKEKLLLTHDYLQTQMLKVSTRFSSNVAPISESDKRSMLKLALEIQIGKLQKTKEKVMNEVEELRKRAKRLNQSTPVRRAGGKTALEGRNGALLKMVLLRVKKKRSVVEDLEAKELNLALVRDTLEQHDLNAGVFESLQKAKTVLMEANNSLTAEKAEKQMDEVQQELQRADEVDQALSTPVGMTDIDDDVLKELETLAAEEVVEQLADIENIPVHKPSNKAEEQKDIFTQEKKEMLCT